MQKKIKAESFEMLTWVDVQLELKAKKKKEATSVVHRQHFWKLGGVKALWRSCNLCASQPKTFMMAFLG